MLKERKKSMELIKELGSEAAGLTGLVLS